MYVAALITLPLLFLLVLKVLILLAKVAPLNDRLVMGGTQFFSAAASTLSLQLDFLGSPVVDGFN